MQLRMKNVVYNYTKIASLRRTKKIIKKNSYVSDF